jgi:polyisoprenoid-binding protein YceI
VSILWTTLRLPNLAAWSCCGLAVCLGGVENVDPATYWQELKPVKQEPKPVTSRFLGFQVPQAISIQPDRPQRFEIVPALSRVGVDMNTPIGSVTAKSSPTRGELVAIPRRPEAQTTAWMVVKTAGLSTGDRNRDAMIHDALRAKSHPEIRVTLRSLKVAKMGTRKLTGTADCTMWICGQTQRLRVAVEAQRDHRQLLVVKGQVKLKLSKMGVEVPRTLGIPLIHDEITLWLAVRGRHLGPDRRHKVVARAR